MPRRTPRTTAPPPVFYDETHRPVAACGCSTFAYCPEHYGQLTGAQKRRHIWGRTPSGGVA